MKNKDKNGGSIMATFTSNGEPITSASPQYDLPIVCNNGILKVSPNLFNKNLVPDANEYINKGNGNANFPTSGEFRHSDFIVIKENTQYYVGIITSIATSAGLAFYDDTQTYISGISLTALGNDNNIITSPNNTKYIRFSFRTDEGYNTNWQNTVYFVEGNQPLAEFMPYGEIYTDGTQEVVTDSLGNTANAEMLLSVRDYKDTQEVISGSVTRNIGVKALDGTENWQAETSLSGYGCAISDAILPTTSDSRLVITTHYKSSTTFPPAGQREGVCVLYYGSSRRNLYVGAMETYTTVEQFKQYLADQYANGTPVIIVYPISSATTETVSGQFLSKSPVTQTAGSIDNLPIAITESSHTVPTPQQPLGILSNNGVLKVSMQLLVNGNLANGTTNWDTAIGVVYTDTTDYAQFYNSASNLVYCRCLPPTRIVGHKYAYILKGYTSSQSGSVSWGSRNSGSFRQMPTTDTLMAGIDEFPSGGCGNPWVSIPVGVTVYINKSAGFRMYDLTALGLDTTITTAEDVINYFGEVYEEPKQIKVSGTVETVEVTGNLVDFNETRINSSTWDSADKTKGFEVYADVYNKSVGDSMLTNANAFGVFVPCKQGESISLNFFDYEPFYSRCLYCEITADRKCNTTPQAYENAGVITQKTFTLTKSDSIGFIFEWYINAQQTRNYTKENYTVIKGTTPPTSYIPYFNGGSASAEMLLKVGDYKDEQSVIDGGVSRNVGIKVLDGSEGWSYYSVTQGNMFRTKIAGSVSGNKDTIGVICNAYTVISTSSRADNTLSGATENFDFINNDYTTLDGWKKYLSDQYNAGFPVIVVYPLAESTTESVSGQPLTTQAGTNIVEITQASIDDLELEVSYKAGVAVTITEVENAQLDNNVEVTIQ